MKKRIDLILVKRKIADSRNKAQAMIMAGQVYIDEKKVLKSGELFDENIYIKFKKLHPDWVSRGAIKLLHAFDYFKLEILNFKCLDIGASTGGFTQVLLSKNANKVYCVDVGTNQLHEKILSNPKVINIPKTNARYLNKKVILDKIDIIVCDVSFISMKKVLKPSLDFLDVNSGIVVGLIKPQFESEKKNIKKDGVILDTKIHKNICDNYKHWFSEVCKMEVLGITPSPIKGPKGNIEFLICAKKVASNFINNEGSDQQEL